jgi:hypothetical protein
MTTAIQKKAAKFKRLILEGHMLCIDPSSGSRGWKGSGTGSMPGYAVFKKGVLVDSGIIEIPGLSRDVGYRLQDLATILRTEFELPDLLVVEKISGRARVSLVKSAGAILASVLAPAIIEIAPRSWQAWVPANRWTRATKSDENDAKGIGYALIEMLGDESCPSKIESRRTPRRRSKPKKNEPRTTSES